MKEIITYDNEITIYTDGGCEPNPGKGAWAFVCPDTHFTQTGFEPSTTSNRMEITAVIKASHNGDTYNEHCDELVRLAYSEVFGGRMRY